MNPRTGRRLRPPDPARLTLLPPRVSPIQPQGRNLARGSVSARWATRCLLGADGGREMGAAGSAGARSITCPGSPAFKLSDRCFLLHRDHGSGDFPCSATLDPSCGELLPTACSPPDQQVFFLHSHAVTITAADGVNISSPMAVGKALEAQLSVPAHSLRVTAHHPENFFVTFTQPRFIVNAGAGSIRIDGALSSARGTQHDSPRSTSSFSTSAAIEKVPMHFVGGGAEEIWPGGCAADRRQPDLERGHTKTFAAGWARRADIPTPHTRWGPSRAGQVEEMEDSPACESCATAASRSILC
ncbi:hypothetical protein ZWY2020_003740 [Hordeum vulgare]|nr:hypothetical protein ZWY2020_003740 [Hordeum vulgare]